MNKMRARRANLIEVNLQLSFESIASSSSSMILHISRVRGEDALPCGLQ